MSYCGLPRAVRLSFQPQKYQIDMNNCLNNIAVRVNLYEMQWAIMLTFNLYNIATEAPKQ